MERLFGTEAVTSGERVGHRLSLFMKCFGMLKKSEKTNPSFTQAFAPMVSLFGVYRYM